MLNKYKKYFKIYVLEGLIIKSKVQQNNFNSIQQLMIYLANVMSPYIIKPILRFRNI